MSIHHKILKPIYFQLNILYVHTLTPIIEYQRDKSTPLNAWCQKRGTLVSEGRAEQLDFIIEDIRQYYIERRTEFLEPSTLGLNLR